MMGKLKALTLLAGAIILAGAARAAVVPPDPIDEKKIEEITKMTAPSVVRVETQVGIRKVATGVVIDKDGFIATTALIEPGDEEITVTTADGRVLKAEFKGFDAQTHVALIQVKEKGLQPIAMGKSADLKPGAWIGVVGLSPENTPSVTQGIVSSTAPERLRLNVWVVPGSSGSPVVNAAGQMVGLLRGTYTDEQPVVFEFREKSVVGSGYALSRGEAPSAGMALAVPADVVVSVAADIRKSGKVLRGWLGVTSGETDGKVEIASVEPKSPADQAKLKEGDVILKVDGKDLRSSQMLLDEIRARKPGTDVAFKIERDGKPLDVKVKLGEYSEDNAKRELEIAFPNLFPPLGSRPPKARAFTAPVTPGPGLPFRWETRRYIGVAGEPMNKELAEAWGAKDGYGLLVTSLDDAGTAKKAGLKVGDIILKADGRKVESTGDLSGIIQDKKKGDKVRLDVVRDKKAMAIDVPIGENDKGGNLFIREPEDMAGLMREQSLTLPEALAKAAPEFEKMTGDRLKLLDGEAAKMQKKALEFGKSPELWKVIKSPGTYIRI